MHTAGFLNWGTIAESWKSSAEIWLSRNHISTKCNCHGSFLWKLDTLNKSPLNLATTNPVTKGQFESMTKSISVVDKWYSFLGILIEPLVANLWPLSLIHATCCDTIFQAHINIWLHITSTVNLLRQLILGMVSGNLTGSFHEVGAHFVTVSHVTSATLKHLFPSMWIWNWHCYESCKVFAGCSLSQLCGNLKTKRQIYIFFSNFVFWTEFPI